MFPRTRRWVIAFVDICSKTQKAFNFWWTTLWLTYMMRFETCAIVAPLIGAALSFTHRNRDLSRIARGALSRDIEPQTRQVCFRQEIVCWAKSVRIGMGAL